VGKKQFSLLLAPLDRFWENALVAPLEKSFRRTWLRFSFQTGGIYLRLPCFCTVSLPLFSGMTCTLHKNQVHYSGVML